LPEEYEITPVGPWRSAVKCTVKKIATGEITPDVQIVRCFPPDSGDEIKYPIAWDKLPILVLNEQLPTNLNNADPIHEMLNEMKLKQVSADQNPVEVPMFYNSGWPNGKLLVQE
jgi:hypothetical protein